jgi:hypothetical protein
MWCAEQRTGLANDSHHGDVQKRSSLQHYEKLDSKICQEKTMRSLCTLCARLGVKANVRDTHSVVEIGATG